MKFRVGTILYDRFDLPWKVTHISISGKTRIDLHTPDGVEWRHIYSPYEYHEYSLISSKERIIDAVLEKYKPTLFEKWTERIVGIVRDQSSGR